MDTQAPPPPPPPPAPPAAPPAPLVEGQDADLDAWMTALLQTPPSSPRAAPSKLVAYRKRKSRNERARVDRINTVFLRLARTLGVDYHATQKAVLLEGTLMALMTRNDDGLR